MSGLRVRAAEAADLEAVVRIERATAAAPHWGAEVYAAMISGEAVAAVARRLLVAEVEGVVGFAVAKVLRVGSGAVAELESVAVAEPARRQGIGRSLCVAAIAWCRSEGAGEVELEVRASSQNAIALYRALGFMETGRRRVYYQHPTEDALLMGLKLG